MSAKQTPKESTPVVSNEPTHEPAAFENNTINTNDTPAVEMSPVRVAANNEPTAASSNNTIPTVESDDDDDHQKDDKDALSGITTTQTYLPDLPWYTYPPSTAFRLTNHANEKYSRKHGLTSAQAAVNDKELGNNIIPVKGGPNPLKILAAQFLNSITAILLTVAIVSAVFEDWVEFGVVMAIILTNGALGFYQEYTAALSLEALKKMTAGTAKVLRDGTVMVVEPERLVVGDVVILEQGDEVPADIRMFDVSSDLSINEALLTGEAEPVAKRFDAIPDPDSRCALGDRKNMAYRATNVVSGRGRGVVVAAGLKTEMGKLASRLSGGSESARTPLMKKMDLMLYVLFGCCIILAIVVFAVDKMVFSEKTLMYACAVAIAILPESLTVVLTVAMTLSIRRMAKEKCIVRKLGVLEVLGGVTDICSDKTGTLTENKMVVRIAFVGVMKSYSVHGASRGCDGHFIERPANSQNYNAATPQNSGGNNTPQGAGTPMASLHTNFRAKSRQSRLDVEKAGPMHQEFLRAASLCSSVRMHINPENESEVTAEGNPTEIAIQTMAWKADREPEFFEAHERCERIGEYPFNSSVKRMTTVYRLMPGRRENDDGSAPASEPTPVIYTFTKGAPERILDICEWQYDVDGKIKPLTKDDRTILSKNISGMANYGLRTICIARRYVEEHPFSALPDFTKEGGPSFDQLNKREDVEEKLVYLGIVGIQDPPRRESGPSVNICQHAGITVRMLTGDHGATAAAIADDLGILQTYEDRTDPEKVMIGPDFDKMTDEEVDRLKDLPAVIGRCSPESKVKMIEALHRRERVVAMTGDGFNDSPSIKKADVGCAMGSGTDVTKGVADIVITDDNFRTIVKAVREGRRIAEVIRHFVIHLLTSNIAEVVALIIGLCIRHEDRSIFILSPLQILWLNMVTSSPPAIGLSMDDVDDDILERPPNRKGLFTAELITDFMVSGIIMGTVCLCSFVYVAYGGNDGLEGTNCNSSSGEGCDVVWTARATAFSVLYVCLLIHAYNVRHGRRSILKIRWFDNPVIYLNVLFGIACLMITLYVETIATNVFIHKQLTWEWAVVAVALVIFEVSYEIYKFCKRWIFPLEVVRIDPVTDRTNFVVGSFSGSTPMATPMSNESRQGTDYYQPQVSPSASFRLGATASHQGAAVNPYAHIPGTPQTAEEREAYRRMVRDTLETPQASNYDVRSVQDIARENLAGSYALKRERTMQEYREEH